jgi:GEVED domain-containing protein/CARDB protein
MKKTLMSLITLLLVIISQNMLAQKNEVTKASKFGAIAKPVIVPSLATQISDGTFVGVDQNESAKAGPPKRRGANKHVPGKGLPKGNDPLVNNTSSRTQHRGKEPTLVFDANVSPYTPSDPTGAVGPDHFIGAWNSGFRIFDKDGNPLTDEASLSTLFPGNDLGDPIVFYDAQAERFVITEFDNSPDGFNMAICMGPDPVNDGWYIYTTGFGTGAFPDYTKFSVWSDGYYVTANIGDDDRVFVVERDEMLLGNPSQFVAFPLPGLTTSGFYSPQFFNVINDDLPPVGNASVVYMQDDAWAGVSQDHLKVWTVNVDWDDIANSTISNPDEIVTSPFISVFDGGSFSNVPQPSGPDQDVLQATIMNQAQFRRFPGYNSAIFNFVVDTDGSGDELAGIRWYELRQTNDGDPWTIYQEGTYVSPVSERNAFSGSMVMDGQGNIGMGYTTCSSSDKIAIYYTGRYGADPLGEMTIDETLIAQSTSNNGSNRLADYVQISLDPTNDKTFWHIAEYFVSGQRTDVVGVFQIASDFSNDVGVMSIDAPVDGELSASEPITITVFNYGEEPQSNIPVSFMIDGANMVSETLAGPIGSGTSEQYTFTATANLGNVGQTYEITAYTDLAIDEFRDNDTTTKSVFHMFPHDIGVIGVIEPVSGNNLTEEDITVTIENFGTADQTNFDVSYNLDDVVVTEQVPGPLTSNDKINYTFSQSGDFAAIGNHLLSSYTSLPDDSDRYNDTTSVVITKNMCQPEADCSAGDGIFLFKLGTIDNATECSPNGYGDYTDLITELETNSTNNLTITTHYGDQYVKVWIDFNDNFVFENNEVVVDNELIAAGSGSGNFSLTMPLVIPVGTNLGHHLMRAKSNWNAPVPPDACEGTQYGETEDYMADIVLSIGVEELPLQNTEMIVKTLGNNKFQISMKDTEINEVLVVNLINVMGQKLIENKVENINGIYSYDLDMSYAKPGAYIIRLGNQQYGHVKKIIVK